MPDNDDDRGDYDLSENREALGAPTDVAVALHAGSALFNEGFVLAAHDPWEAAWLPLDANGAVDAGEYGDDERLLHGLIATAAATHHATDRNWAGAVGCAENAVDYLTPIEPQYRGLALDPVREWCRRLAADPETVERRGRPDIRIDERVVGFADLDLAATTVAAPVVAETVTSGEKGVVSAAADLAREEYGTGRSTIAELLFSFLQHPDSRPQIAARLADRVERAERKRRDVDDLFE
ncbi:putative metal-dependent hydrolase [Halorubrum alkaliphilum]|uniref:Putative metal-dependent hydrolase n=1 Tax=Halorubrum alkaliphilum TaxID=261290 RepID=A0A8T4GEJ1_9EURY|nr:DUF309 domain-containing protein [Halorubrum alkaliphilum]MBP1922566.1 putative metal-dependent hydrolase [Halorubrum alkaliphilum]